MTTVRQLFSQTAEVVGDRQHARWLVETAVAADRLDAVLDEPVTERMVAHLDRMVGRYRAGEPLQYVLGRWSFRYIDLAVDPRVLIPRPETEELAGIAIDAAARRSPRRVLDLGTGSGAIGLSMAFELPLEGTEVWITDVDADALDVARANLAGIGRAARNVHIAQGAWFDAVAPGLAFDVIVSNPPYIALGDDRLDSIVRDYEPHRALFAGADGLDSIREIISGSPSRLSGGGMLMLEIGHGQGEAVRTLMDTAGFASVEVRLDAAGRERIAVGSLAAGM